METPSSKTSLRRAENPVLYAKKKSYSFENQWNNFINLVKAIFGKCFSPPISDHPLVVII